MLLSAIISIAVLIVVAAAVIIYRRHQAAEWARRPERLCLACDQVHQPARVGTSGLRCPTCMALGPVLLSSPQAEAHRQAKLTGATPKSNPKVWVPRPKDDITRYG